MEDIAAEIEQLHLNQREGSPLDLSDMTGLPDTVIVTNMSEVIFDDAAARASFENLFRNYDSNASFQYLKSFRRARVVFGSTIAAAKARIKLHQQTVHGKAIKCYFAQPLSSGSAPSSPHLQPPIPTKQFLISPPASPPVDWEPVHEGTPVINYDLLAAIANMAPGEAHELHPPSESHPAIVVHICENPAGYGNLPMQQTRRPDPSPSS